MQMVLILMARTVSLHVQLGIEFQSANKSLEYVAFEA